jgi:uncharacterized protein (AIM24 family)
MQFAAGTAVDMGRALVFTIKGKPAFAYADVELQAGQRIVTDGDMLLWMDTGISEPDTTCWGGCCQGFCRMLANEKACMNTFTNETGEARRLSFGGTDPADMLSFAVTPGNGWVLNDGAFVLGTDNLKIGARFVGCCAACCSGENLFLTKVTLKKEEQAGVFIAHGYGALVRHDIPAGSVLYVSPGLFFAAHETTKIKMGIAGNSRTCCCTWVAWVMKFYGPTVVYTQSRDPKSWNPLKYVPTQRSKQSASTS